YISHSFFKLHTSPRIYTLSLHDALPILASCSRSASCSGACRARRLRVSAAGSGIHGAAERTAEPALDGRTLGDELRPCGARPAHRERRAAQAGEPYLTWR